MRRTVVFVGVLMWLAACRQETPPRSPSGKASAAKKIRKSHYFPYRIALSDGTFRSVTFKDVGLGRSNPRADDPLLEVIAESVALHLTTSSRGRLEAEVQHDPTLLDPANHFACEAQNLYVDLWRPSARHWGFSLWSGCGSDDNFAWREIELGRPSRDTIGTVEPLSREVVRSLRRAEQRGCFRRTC